MTICKDFGVPNRRIRIVATEATRTALNSDDFLGTIHNKAGLKVELLSKEEEGQIGALGIVSSFDRAEGLLMDLGGGSVQLSWLVSLETVKRENGSVSLPYGAAALMKRLSSVKNETGKDELYQEIKSAILRALNSIGFPSQLGQGTESKEPLRIFLSGGGFRGWGYILMSKHAIQPYPIPIINGFSVNSKEFIPLNVSQFSEMDNPTFRISSRRSSQVPAISFLISALTSVLSTKLEQARVYFAQGESYIYFLP